MRNDGCYQSHVRVDAISMNYLSLTGGIQPPTAVAPCALSATIDSRSRAGSPKERGYGSSALVLR